MTGPRRWVVVLVLAAGTFVGRPMPVEAQLFSCTISTTGVAFGSYSVFAGAPATSTGSITYNCTIGLFIALELDAGASGTFAPRTLTSGPSTLDYNLYLDPAYGTVWGDGSGSTGRHTQIISIFTNVRTVYARIPALQDVPAGAYVDAVTATVIW